MVITEAFDEIPCVAYLDGKIFKTFKSRRECATYFRKRYANTIMYTIRRKGNIIFEGKRYAIRNYNPDKDK